ncbi:RICIN domain-containing protein [Streptomyces sp. NPDC055815]
MNDSVSPPSRRTALRVALLIALLVAALLPTAPARAASVTVPVGAPITDTTGNPVHTHGGGVINVNGSFYWFGEDRNPDDTFRSLSVWRSTDLKNWEFRNHVLTQASHPELQLANLERPKVVHNAATGQFVLWAHKENGVDYTEAEVAVAVSSTVDGDYTYQGSFRPLGHESRDMTLFRDDDGSAYLISAANDNADLHVYRLTADYTNVQSQVQTLFPGARREAPAMFKRNGVYFLLTSGQKGWLPTQQQYATASCVACAWSANANVGDSQAYGSQTAYVLTVQGTQATTYLYLGDRWAGSWGGPVEDSTYVRLPLNFPTATTMTMAYARELAVDTTAGTVTPIGTGYDRLTVRHSGRCVKANQSAVVQYGCTGNTDQQWRIDSLADGESRLVSRSANKCMDLATAVITWTCGVAKPKQHWTVRDLGTGYVQLVNAVTGECAEVANASTADNAQLRPAVCTGATHQQFQRTSL